MKAILPVIYHTPHLITGPAKMSLSRLPADHGMKFRAFFTNTVMWRELAMCRRSLGECLRRDQLGFHPRVYLPDDLTQLLTIGRYGAIVVRDGPVVALPQDPSISPSLVPPVQEKALDSVHHLRKSPSAVSDAVPPRLVDSLP
jgi:hypothetical protein